MTEEESTQRSDFVVDVVGVSSTTPHSEALVEAGRDLISQSLAVGRDFCKFMITASMSAIPVYLGILGFILPGDFTLGFWRGVLILSSVVLYLAAAVLFTVGYFPVATTFSLDIIEEIEAVRNRTIRRRQRITKLAFGLFLVASLLASVVIVVHLGGR